MNGGTTSNPMDPSRRLTRRTVLKGGLAAASAAFLAACAGASTTSAPGSPAPSSPPSTPPPPTPAPATAAPAASPTPIITPGPTPAPTPVSYAGVTLNLFSGTAMTPIAESLKAGWETLTGGKVVVTNIPYADRRAKLAGIIATQDSSWDLGYIYESWIPGFDERLYVDISESAGDTSDFLKGPLDSLRSPVTGHLLGLPMYSDQWIWIYNRELYQKAGLDPDKPPTTWDELYAAVPKFKEAGVFGSAAVWLASLQAVPIFLWTAIWNQFSLPMFSADRTQVLFGGPEGLQTFEVIERGMKAGFWDPNAMTLASEIETALLFNQGLIAGQMGWGSFFGQARSKNVTDFNAKLDPAVVAATTVPGITAGKSGTVNGSEGYGVFKFSKNQEAALSFLTWLTDTAQGKKAFLDAVPKGTQLSPVRTSVLEDPEVSAAFPIADVWTAQGQFQNSLHAAPYDPAPVFAEVLAKLWKGEYTALAAHEAAVKGTQDLIIKYLSS